MGSINQGCRPNLPRWRMVARLRRWGLTYKSIGRWLGVTRQAIHHCLLKYRKARTNLSLSRILTWADAYRACTGKWPNARTVRIPGVPGLNWRSIDNALRFGFRGLPGGSTLAQILAEHRGVRNVHSLQPLSAPLILRWADEYHGRTGKWPTENSGQIAGTPGEVWQNVDMALREGHRGFRGGSSLAKLLANHRKVRNKANIPRLTSKQILIWADEHFKGTGKWPNHDSGPIVSAPGETWLAIESALRSGVRGLFGGSSLARLLSEKRGVRNRGSLPRLKKRQILSWAKSHYQRTGRWPTGYSGAVADAPGETWKAIEMALFQGLRGLPGGMTLSQLLKRYGLKSQKDL